MPRHTYLVTPASAQAQSARIRHDMYALTCSTHITRRTRPGDAPAQASESSETAEPTQTSSNTVFQIVCFPHSNTAFPIAPHSPQPDRSECPVSRWRKRGRPSAATVSHEDSPGNALSKSTTRAVHVQFAEFCLTTITEIQTSLVSLVIFPLW